MDFYKDFVYTFITYDGHAIDVATRYAETVCEADLIRTNKIIPHVILRRQTSERSNWRADKIHTTKIKGHPVLGKTLLLTILPIHLATLENTRSNPENDHGEKHEGISP